jgi:hypothetical protein
MVGMRRISSNNRKGSWRDIKSDSWRGITCRAIFLSGELTQNKRINKIIKKRNKDILKRSNAKSTNISVIFHVF